MKAGILERWVIGYLAVFLLLAASNVFAILKLNTLGTTTIPSLNVDIRILDRQQKLLDSLLSQLRYERKYLLAKNVDFLSQFVEASREFTKNLSEGRAIADTPAKTGSFNSIEMYHKRYETLVNEEVGHLTENRPYRRSDFRVEKDKASDAILAELKTLEGYARADMGLKMSTVGDAGRSALRMALIASLITLFCALLISVFVTRSITNPLRKLVKKTREVSTGVFKGDLRIKSPPEISELATAFNSMCEELMAVDRMKGDFLTMISHELRTPLTTINEGTNLLLEKVVGEITDKQARLLTILLAETKRLIGMVNSILDLSKMEAGMMTYSFSKGNVVPLIDQAMTEITPLVQSKHIQLEKTVNGDIPLLRMDPERILQVLRNLIGNAAKFTPEKGRIAVSARAVGKGVEVSVQDTGPGIPAERLPRVFEKFTGSDLRGGTGLGLAIVKHIVDAHGGAVRVESKPDQGSKFIFALSS